MRWYGIKEGVMVYKPDSVVGTHHSGDEEVFGEMLCDVDEEMVPIESVYDFAVIVKDEEGLEKMNIEDDYEAVPPIETVEQCSIKEEEERETTLERDDSSATLTAFSDLATQLEEAAASSEQSFHQHSPVWSSPISERSSTLGAEESPPSPCLRENRTQSFEDLSVSSESRVFGMTLPVNRRLEFGAPKNANESSPKSPHSSEKAPRHIWSESERELLCVLNRYYEPENADTIPILFNYITGLNLRHHIFRGQFDHVKRYGPRAFISYRRVFSAPFNKRGHYQEMRKMIETEAASLGIHLPRRTVESRPESKAGKAAFSKSPRIKNRWKDTVWTTPQTEREAAVVGNTTKAPSEPVLDQGEVFTDAEDVPVVAVENVDPVRRVNREVARSGHHLAFRTWCDDTSATTFRDGGFIANFFADLQNPVTPNIPADDQYRIFEVFAIHHLSFQSRASSFVSVVTSLLQLLTYAGKKRSDDTDTDKIKIAVIDLNTPELNTINKKHYASDVIRQLQSKGEAPWTNGPHGYKGTCEYLIWGSIPREAIIATFTLADLERLSRESPSSASLLNLQYFTPHTTTPKAGKRLKEKDLMLTTRTASAIGKIARTFGLSSPSVTTAHIEDFVAALVSGWNISGAPLGDNAAIGSLAAAFAVGRGGERGGLGNAKVMGAFIDGVERGEGRR